MSPKPKNNSKKSWSKVQSGDASFGRLMKQQAQSFVRVLTDDLEISLGVLLRKSRHRVRVGFCKRSGTSRKAQRWDVVDITPGRIVELQGLS